MNRTRKRDWSPERSTASAATVWSSPPEPAPSEPGDRQPVLDERRPPRVRTPGQAGQRAPADAAQPRSGHHQLHPAVRRTGRRTGHGTRRVHPGRGTPGVRGVARRRRSRTAGSLPGGPLPGREAAARPNLPRPGPQPRGRVRRSPRQRRVHRYVPAAARDGPRRAGRRTTHAQRPVGQYLDGTGRQRGPVRADARHHAANRRRARRRIRRPSAVAPAARPHRAPLGGAPIGRHPGIGVCDPYGEVFGHPGLYVADGAPMPGPVGPNPALTIMALADRMCTPLLEHVPPRHRRSRTARTPVAPLCSSRRDCGDATHQVRTGP
ncbi:GMC oxidoreductase [Streptomyces sp. NPDC047081]|uniref:GMC oxidoreductase n=1 Tax=Streptomyces sp. NPDC047081 TaxID=3154706 RepID=UPI0033CCD346